MKAISSPSRYIQGAGILYESAVEILKIGHRPLVLCDETIYNKIGNKFIKNITCYGCMPMTSFLMGDVTDIQVFAHARTAEEHKADMVIGLGGGRILDMTKLVAGLLELPYVLIPTILSTPASTSSCAILHEGYSRSDTVRGQLGEPSLVIADTQLFLHHAPLSILELGLVRCLTCLAAESICQDEEQVSVMDRLLIQGCEQLLLSKGKDAYQSYQLQATSKSLEDVVEVITFLTGMATHHDAVRLVSLLYTEIIARYSESIQGKEEQIFTCVHLVLLQLRNCSEKEWQSYLEFYRDLNLLPPLNSLPFSSTTGLSQTCRTSLEGLPVSIEQLEKAVQELPKLLFSLKE